MNMDAQFEKEKNLKALGITAMISLLVFLIFFLISWTDPGVVEPIADYGIEVNLGNSDAGFGNNAPMMPGRPLLKRIPIIHHPFPRLHLQKHKRKLPRIMMRMHHQ